LWPTSLSLRAQRLQCPDPVWAVWITKVEVKVEVEGIEYFTEKPMNNKKARMRKRPVFFI
jgi:hypothetical protein